MYAPQAPGYFDPFPYREEPKGPVYVPPKDDLETKLRKSQKKHPFVPAGPGKTTGGCYDGGFSTWPQHFDPRPIKPKISKEQKENQKKKGKPTFVPVGVNPKALYTRSILENTNFTVNATNYKHCTPTYVTHL